MKTFKPERIYLFGSHARGDWHADSDYDLMVVPTSHVPPHRRGQLAYRALFDIGIPKNIVVWTCEEFDR